MTFKPSPIAMRRSAGCAPNHLGVEPQFRGLITDLDDVNGQQDFPVGGQLISLLADTPAEPA
jgi:hypothetical protein